MPRRSSGASGRSLISDHLLLFIRDYWPMETASPTTEEGALTPTSARRRYRGF